jgi:hypothetical protein
MNMRKIPIPACCKNGHDLQRLTDKDRDYWVVLGCDTLLYKTYICSKCGEVRDIQVGVWSNFIPKSKEQRKLEKKISRLKG